MRSSVIPSFVICLLVTVGITSPSFADDDSRIKGAGVIAYSYNNAGRLVILLGEEYRKKSKKYLWSELAGDVDEKENARAAAARELEEESRGVYQQNVYKTRIDPKRFIENKKERTRLFIVEVDYIDTAELKKKKKPKKDTKDNYCWVPYEDFIQLIDGAVKAKNDLEDLDLPNFCQGRYQTLHLWTVENFRNKKLRKIFSKIPKNRAAAE